MAVSDVADYTDRRYLYLGNERLKRVGVKLEFTPEQVAEWTRCAIDQEYFIRNYINIVTTHSGIQLMQPFDYQLEIMDKLKENNHVVALTSRQAGKCIALNTKVTVRNKRTGKVERITVGELHDRARKHNATKSSTNSSGT